MNGALCKFLPKTRYEVIQRLDRSGMQRISFVLHCAFSAIQILLDQFIVSN